VGPEYLAVIATAIVSAFTGGTWVANKILDRQQERVQQAFDYIGSQKRRIDLLEDQVNRMPIEYVLKQISSEKSRKCTITLSKSITSLIS